MRSSFARDGVRFSSASPTMIEFARSISAIARCRVVSSVNEMILVEIDFQRDIPIPPEKHIPSKPSPIYRSMFFGIEFLSSDNALSAEIF